VWCSGTFEHWLPVRDLVAALQNAVDGKAGTDKPMAIIRDVTA
jgi:F420-0:gamma-glutamyl ligase